MVCKLQFHNARNPTCNPQSTTPLFPSHHKMRSHIYFQQASNLLRQVRITFLVMINVQQCGFWIAWPTYPIPLPQPPPQIPPSHDLVTQLWWLVPDYAPELWSHLQCNPTTDTTTLAKHISQNQGKLIIISNASFNAQHWSTFSWSIATPETKLWSGKGTSPSTQWDAHSSQSKGYRFLLAFTVLEKYIASNLILPAHPKPIIGYCDNSGLIQQVTVLQTATNPNPLQTLSNDYNLSNKIYQTIQWIPVPIMLWHIKGHQDKNTEVEDSHLKHNSI